MGVLSLTIGEEGTGYCLFSKFILSLARRDLNNIGEVSSASSLGADFVGVFSLGWSLVVSLEFDLSSVLIDGGLCCVVSCLGSDSLGCIGSWKFSLLLVVSAGFVGTSSVVLDCSYDKQRLE